ncbi:MAG: thioredoxin-disulfide reductase [Candidatus Bathyarchaeota archaeon]|nr:thioredoxin-disulfide reductase [Candidatus Bathyarchaeota archaeon]
MYDVIVIGSGPAGLTAAIYAARGGLRTLVLAGSVWGGQLMFTGLVENFPGFRDGVSGHDLMVAMVEQAKRFGAEIVFEDASSVDFSMKPFKIASREAVYEARAVIIATGSSPRRLGLESEKRFIGRGVSFCAVCDAPLMRGRVAVVVGGGDTALEEALALSKYAREVMIVHRRDRLRAARILQERAFQEPRIRFLWNCVVEEIFGSERVEGVRLRRVDSGTSTLVECDGVFVAIGRQPNTEIFRGQVMMDEAGYIILRDGTMTSVEGVFVAGEAADGRYRQAVVSAGLGCMAAIDAIKYLEMQG